MPETDAEQSFIPTANTKYGTGGSSEALSPSDFPPEVPALRAKKAFLEQIFPQEAGDLKVFWSKWALAATLVASLLCALCETWIMLNENAIKRDLLGAQYQNGSDATYQIWTNFKVELTYHSIFLGSIGFWLFITWNGIMHQNLLQIFSINFFNIGLLVYSIMQILQTNNDLNTVKSHLSDPTIANDSGSFLAAQILLPSVIAVFIPVFVFLTYKLKGEFGWRMYRITGGDPKVTRAFTAYHVLLLLFKYSVFAGTGFMIIDLVLTSITTAGVISIPIVAAFIALGTVIAGFYSARFENKPFMVVFLVGCLGIFGYIVDRFVHAFQRGGDEFQRAKIPFIAFGVLCEGLLIACVVYGVLVMRNFGEGLMSVLEQEVKRRRGEYQAPEIDMDA
ncbi:hypothetical protein HDU98_011092 [Podochytrium sp. JEL0797]|nr:hypothetical protein HDU98_011092 [Podochytrium sp. JEL0797]